MAARNEKPVDQSPVESEKPKLPAAMRVIEVIRLVSSEPGSLTLADLSERMSLTKSTVHRLVDFLCDGGYLYRDSDGRALWIGSNLRDLAFTAIHNDFLRSSIRQTLADVTHLVGETCNIAVLDGTDVRYLQRVEARWPLRLNLDLNSRIPVHCCASGKLFLALLNESRRQKILRRTKFEPITPRTITDESELMEELDVVRKQGYALDDQEFIDGMVAIAVPILGRKGGINATLSVHAPTVRCASATGLVQWIDLLRDGSTKLARIMESAN